MKHIRLFVTVALFASIALGQTQQELKQRWEANRQKTPRAGMFFTDTYSFQSMPDTGTVYRYIIGPDTIYADRESAWGMVGVLSMLRLYEIFEQECTSEARLARLLRDSVWILPVDRQWERVLYRTPDLPGFMHFLEKRIRPNTNSR